MCVCAKKDQRGGNSIYYVCCHIVSLIGRVAATTTVKLTHTLTHIHTWKALVDTRKLTVTYTSLPVRTVRIVVKQSVCQFTQKRVAHTHTHTGTKVPTCLHIHAYITGVISVDGLKNSINFTFTHRSVNSFIHSVSQPVELTTTLTRKMLKHALLAYFPPLCGNNSKIFNFVNLQNSRIFHLHLNRKCRTLVQHGWWQAASGKWQVIVKLQNWIW